MSILQPLFTSLTATSPTKNSTITYQFNKSKTLLTGSLLFKYGNPIKKLLPYYTRYNSSRKIFTKTDIVGIKNTPIILVWWIIFWDLLDKTIYREEVRARFLASLSSVLPSLNLGQLKKNAAQLGHKDDWVAYITSLIDKDTIYKYNQFERALVTAGLVVFFEAFAELVDSILCYATDYIRSDSRWTVSDRRRNSAIDVYNHHYSDYEKIATNRLPTKWIVASLALALCFDIPSDKQTWLVDYKDPYGYATRADIPRLSDETVATLTVAERETDSWTDFFSTIQSNANEESWESYYRLRLRTFAGDYGNPGSMSGSTYANSQSTSIHPSTTKVTITQGKSESFAGMRYNPKTRVRSATPLNINNTILQNRSSVYQTSSNWRSMLFTIGGLEQAFRDANISVVTFDEPYNTNNGFPVRENYHENRHCIINQTVGTQNVVEQTPDYTRPSHRPFWIIDGPLYHATNPSQSNFDTYSFVNDFVYLDKDVNASARVFTNALYENEHHPFCTTRMVEAFLDDHSYLISPAFVHFSNIQKALSELGLSSFAASLEKTPSLRYADLPYLSLYRLLLHPYSSKLQLSNFLYETLRSGLAFTAILGN